ncbi:hypothetical protein EVAR_77527_1 [Eumeta japonica]|uniref:Uncharacterized protein n=1 Tax=Eumeta variegata TaxID=151549 RepID=A0A4C1T7J1_EUMVA|nr:hypothetical protein EVAR_77527_1 [Eumeta japonica]
MSWQHPRNINFQTGFVAEEQIRRSASGFIPRVTTYSKQAFNKPPFMNYVTCLRGAGGQWNVPMRAKGSKQEIVNEIHRKGGAGTSYLRKQSNLDIKDSLEPERKKAKHRSEPRSRWTDDLVIYSCRDFLLSRCYLRSIIARHLRVRRGAPTPIPPTKTVAITRHSLGKTEVRKGNHFSRLSRPFAAADGRARQVRLATRAGPARNVGPRAPRSLRRPEYFMKNGKTGTREGELWSPVDTHEFRLRCAHTFTTSYTPVTSDAGGSATSVFGERDVGHKRLNQRGEKMDSPRTSGNASVELCAVAVSLLLGRIGRRSGREIARSALSLARSAQAERDNESCFVVLAAGVHRYC